MAKVDEEKAKKIDVVVSSYNCSWHLKEAIYSVLSQNGVCCNIYLRDDGSVSGCLHDVVQEMHLCDIGNTFVYVSNDNLGVVKSFSYLLEKTCSNYIAFCDQDDVWHHEKLSLELNEMQRLEKIYPGKPIVVHSDLEVVDAELNTLASSFFDSQRLPRQHPTALDQMIQNNVTGCTMLINQAARELVTPIPNEAIMHDWWIAAKVRHHGGVIGLVDQPLVKYRQHGGNFVGAKQIDAKYYLKELSKQHGFFKPLWAIYKQAKAIDPTISLWDVVSRKVVLTFRRARRQRG